MMLRLCAVVVVAAAAAGDVQSAPSSPTAPDHVNGVVVESAILAAASNCSNFLYGVGMHGSDGGSTHRGQTLATCCALRNLTGADAFTFHNTTGECVLSSDPLTPHMSAGTQDATSGCAGQCPTAAPTAPAGPLPGPLPPGWSPASFPPAKTTMPPTPTFPKAPRPNIVLFFGDDIGYVGTTTTTACIH
jgi:hypothetical protein